MTRKDFELIADVLYEHKVKAISSTSNGVRLSSSYISEFTVDDLAKAFAEKLDATNPRFNKDIFLSRATKNR